MVSEKSVRTAKLANTDSFIAANCRKSLRTRRQVSLPTSPPSASLCPTLILSREAQSASNKWPLAATPLHCWASSLGQLFAKLPHCFASFAHGSLAPASCRCSKPHNYHPLLCKIAKPPGKQSSADSRRRAASGRRDAAAFQAQRSIISGPESRSGWAGLACPAGRRHLRASGACMAPLADSLAGRPTRLAPVCENSAGRPVAAERRRKPQGSGSPPAGTVCPQFPSRVLFSF